MDIHPCGSRPSQRADASYFTGTVWLDVIIDPPSPARVRALFVRFEPGARTHWHTHPFGQTLHIVTGIGRVQSWGGPLREVRPGDTVWIAPDEKHWHGAGPTAGMVHIAMQEGRDGKYADWLEKVSDAQYNSAAG